MSARLMIPKTIIVLATLLLSLLAVRVVKAQEPPPLPPAAAVEIPNETCLTCHRKADLHLDFSSGTQLPVTVDEAMLAGSVHSGLNCQDCHTDIAGYPHGTPPADSHRELQVYYSQGCANCHTEQALSLIHI